MGVSKPADEDLARQRRDRREIVAEIVGGEETTEFPEAAVVGARFSSGRVQWGGSGVLIHPRLVLTAAHVLRLDPNVVVVNAAAVTQGQSPAAGQGMMLTVKRHLIPRGAHRQPSSPNDIALLELDQPATGVLPAKLPAAGGGLLALGDKVQIVGYGFGNPEETQGFGQKRQGCISVKELLLNKTEFRAGGGGEPDTAVGDSGGPALAGCGVAGQRTVVGVTSRSVLVSGNSGSGGIYTLVKPYMAFLEAAIQAAGTAAGGGV
ncbi:MAG: S1 family peptidase [Bryobacteraceae bacterium]|nr:S1 family peptidase [Bryobacteraceae bacterium]